LNEIEKKIEDKATEMEEMVKLLREEMQETMQKLGTE